MKPRATLPKELQDIIMGYYGDIPEPKESTPIILNALQISSEIASFVYTKLTDDELQIQQNNGANAVAFLTFVGCLPPSVAYATLKKGSMFAIQSVERCINKIKDEEKLDNIFVDSKKFTIK